MFGWLNLESANASFRNCLRAESFASALALQAIVMGQIHFSHPAGAYFLQNAMVAEPFTEHAF